MKRMLVLAVMLSGCASGEWTRTDTAYEIAYVATVAADAWSTTGIQYEPGATEREPLTREIVGERPGTADTWQYFAGMAVVHYLVARTLPEDWRRWWQVGGIGYHSYMAIENCDRGYCSRPEPPPPRVCPWCQPLK